MCWKPLETPMSSEEKRPLPASASDRLHSIPWWVWAGAVIMLIVGGYAVYDHGIVYGGLFFVGGMLTLWADFRGQTSSEQEAVANEEGLTPLNRWRWIALVVVALTVIYGVYVVQARSSVFLALFAIHSAIKYSNQLFPDETSSSAVEDTATDPASQSRERTSPSGDSALMHSEPVLDDEQTVVVGVAVGALVYIVGWTVVIPRLFTSAERPSNAALTLVTGLAAVVGYGVTMHFLDEWVNVVVDGDRLTDSFAIGEKSRASRLLKRYWFQVLIGLLLVGFVISTEVLGLW
jgi:hypothetical protein